MDYQEFSIDLAPFEEKVIGQHNVVFEDDTLVVVATNARSFYVSLPSLCHALGLNIKGQVQRIKRSPTLQNSLRQLPLHTRGGQQQIYCLHIEWVDLWLDGLRLKSVQTSSEKIASYQRALVNVVYDVFHRIGHLKGDASLQASLQEYFASTPAPFEAIEAVSEANDPLIQRKLQILTSLPLTNPEMMVHLTSTANQIDQSVREATFARDVQWEETDTSAPTFLSSNNLQISLGTPDEPLDLPTVQAKLRQVGGSTALTARIIMGLWNLRRHDALLSINGSAAAHVEEILAWRGIQKHQRISYPSSAQQRTDGYRIEHKQQVLRDLALLASCNVRGHCKVLVKGVAQTFYINGPYLRYSVVTTPDRWGGEELVGFFVSPGDWISTYESYDRDYLVDIDRRIFHLNPQNEQHELRLSLYLVERWHQQAKSHGYDEPIHMKDLLAASMIPVDKINFSRFASRVEQALDVLWQKGILGAAPQCLTTINKQKSRWSSDWLNAQWVLLPPAKNREISSSPRRE